MLNNELFLVRPENLGCAIFSHGKSKWEIDCQRKQVNQRRTPVLLRYVFRLPPSERVSESCLTYSLNQLFMPFVRWLEFSPKQTWL